MSEDESIQISLTEYRGQLATVETALLSSQGDASLQELKENLLEVIKLLEDQLLSIRKEKLISCLDEKVEDKDQVKEKTEYELFQEEIAALSGNKEANFSTNDATPDLKQCVSELEGKRCRVPHHQEWGELSYHNGLIIGTDAEGAQNIDDIDVCVMFCNPTCDSMKPCSFFLDGHCKFSSDQCRFSHGYVVKLSEIQEFKDPDYSILQRDTFCLAKYHDDLWYNAQVLECLDDHKLKVKYSRYNEEVVLSVEDVLPLDNQPVYSGSDISEDELNDSSSSEDSSSCDDIPQVVWIPSTDIALGDWEKYTKGFGSKLMEQMGYVKGQGLGRNGEGRIDPIEAVILPQGKSLDKCMELREMKESRNVDRVEKRLKQKNNKQANVIANGYKHQLRKERKKNVFDFLNSKLKGKHENHKDRSQTSSQHQHQSGNLKSSSVRGLNVQSLQVSEEINKAQRELKRLQEALARNKDRDRVMKSQLENKICAQQQLLQSLQSQERMISREQTSRKDKRKLTIF